MIEMANTLRSFFHGLPAMKKNRMMCFKAFRGKPVWMSLPDGFLKAFCKEQPGGRCSSSARLVLFKKPTIKILRQEDIYRINLPVAASDG
jgi:hypothetical protein